MLLWCPISKPQRRTVQKSASTIKETTDLSVKPKISLGACLYNKWLLKTIVLKSKRSKDNHLINMIFFSLIILFHPILLSILLPIRILLILQGSHNNLHCRTFKNISEGQNFNYPVATSDLDPVCPFN